MKIKLIIFDLDGVLIDSRPLHYHALNMALEDIDPKYIITLEEHLSKYDGVPTTKKLQLLTQEKGLPVEMHNKIWELKQKYTFDVISKQFQNDDRLQSILRELKAKSYVIYCASNSIWNTIKMMLLKKGIMEYFDFIISNEDVKCPKPSPEMYLKAMARANVSPMETLICEDSHVGREAAQKSGAYLCPIENPSDLTLEKIYKYINMSEDLNSTKTMDLRWKGKINVVIPMAGRGSRFANVGYTFPKPLIEMNNKPMIQVVVENLNVDGHYIFIVQKEHYEKYSLNLLLNNIAPNCDIIQIDGVTEGATCSVLLAEKFIDNDTPLLIANSDQFLEWNSNEFLYVAISDGVDGCISTFYNTHPKWSYAKLNDNGYVTEVQEKKPISTIATTGIYFWKQGREFVKYSKQMIEKNIRVNNEFYVCPVYNEAIADGKLIKVKDCKRMWGIGTPEDLNIFMANYNGKF